MLKKVHINSCLIIFIAVGIIMAFSLRLQLISATNDDIKMALVPWYDFIDQNGFAAFKHNFSIYAPAYLYLLGLATILPFSKILAIKFISIVFDFIGAYFIYRLVRLAYPQSKYAPAISAMTFLFAPTVIMNSSFWGQCDIIHTSLILASLYLVMTAGSYKKILLGIFLLGIAVSIKMLALFMLPVYIILCIKKRVSTFSLLLIPWAYVLSILPAWIAGRNFKELLLLPFSQVDHYHELTKNAPNVYLWLPKIEIFFQAGRFYAAAIVFLLVMVVLMHLRREDFDKKILIKMALLFSLVIPFVCPQMHDRYFYLADVFSILYAFYFPKYFYVPVAMNLTSLFSYLPFLFHRHAVPLNFLPFFTLALILIVGSDFFKTCLQTKKGMAESMKDTINP